MVFAISIGVSATTRAPSSHGSLVRVDDACSIGRSLDEQISHTFIQTLLTDTGEVGVTYARTRAALGIAGVSYARVTVVRDTTTCRKALNAWKADRFSLGAADSAESAAITGARLFRLTPNRYVIATTKYDPLTFLTYAALDSTFTLIRRNF